MVFPYDNRPGGRNARYVPLDVARQLERQRDELLAEVQRLRRETDYLRAANESALSQNEQLTRRATQAEREARELRERIARMEADRQEAAKAERAKQQAAKQQVAKQQADESDADEQEAAEPAKPAASKSVEDAAADKERTELIAQLSSRIDELTSDLERVRERTERTVSTAQRDERVRLLSGLGTVLDSIDRGLDMDASGPWRQGLEAIRSQLMGFLRAEGAELVGSVGERMDPKLHEAVGVDESEEFEPGEIVRVVRHGLELEDGTLVRAAQVIVAS